MFSFIIINPLDIFNFLLISLDFWLSILSLPKEALSMQHILSLVRRCVEDYRMIHAGDTVVVGVSGGKDSVLTLALRR